MQLDINKSKVISYTATQGGFLIFNFNLMTLKFLKDHKCFSSNQTMSEHVSHSFLSKC